MTKYKIIGNSDFAELEKQLNTNFSEYNVVDSEIASKNSAIVVLQKKEVIFNNSPKFKIIGSLDLQKLEDTLNREAIGYHIVDSECTVNGYSMIILQEGADIAEEIEKWFRGIGLTKLDEYLYYVEYRDDQIDYAKAVEYFKTAFMPKFGCSAVNTPKFFGRNFDWTYSEEVSFVVRKSPSSERFASIGICGGIPSLTKEAVETMEWQRLYDYLPFYLVDGINEHGVTVSLNVVPTGDKGITTGTNHDKEGDDICVLMLPSLILDKFATAREAVEWVRDKAKIYAPNSDTLKQELHLLVADESNCFVVEFVNNEAVILEGKNYITNFYLQGTSTDEYGHIKPDTVTPYGQGLERYNIIADNYLNIGDITDMRRVLNLIAYTKTYSDSENPVWKTEFVGNYPEMGLPYPNLTVTSPLEDFQDLLTVARNRFNNRSRNPENPNYGTWQTTHSVIYDRDNLRMRVRTQEQGKSKERVFGL